MIEETKCVFNSRRWNWL